MEPGQPPEPVLRDGVAAHRISNLADRSPWLVGSSPRPEVARLVLQWKPPTYSVQAPGDTQLSGAVLRTNRGIYPFLRRNDAP